MRAPTAAATPLVVLPLMLPMTHGVALSRMFATRQASLDQSGPAGMIRGVPRAARLEAGKREGGKISRRNTESFGPLALLDVCYMTDDCTPGLYVEAGFRTQCEKTPFSGGDTVCCKPFATPCDSDKACCSGNCDASHARCDDAVVPAHPTDEEHSHEDDFYSDEIAYYSDEIAYYSDEIAYYSDEITSDTPKDSSGDIMADQQDGEGGQLYDDGETSYGEYDDVQYRHDKYDDRITGSGLDRYWDGYSGRYSFGQYDYTTSSEDTPRAQDNPLAEDSGTRLYEDRVGSPDNNHDDEKGTEFPPPHDETSGASPKADGAHEGGEGEESTTGPLSTSSTEESSTTICQPDYAAGTIETMASSETRVEAVAMDSQINPGGGVGAEDSSGTGVSMYDSFFEMTSETETAETSAVSLAAGLGPFLPGVAVCPVTGDVYVTRGHTGIARLVKGTDGSFGQKMEWNMVDMAFKDGVKTRAPLMVWDIAVNSIGIVYFTTYVQGVVLKGIFPRQGGAAQVRLVGGKWDSGVSGSSGDGGKALSAVLAYPKGIAVDADDNIYVAEFQGEKIRNISTSGIISTCVGTGSTAYEGDGGPASEAGLDLPNAIAFMPSTPGSRMAIADFGHNAVRVVTPTSLCP
ncbi:NHL repeat-containing protein [Ectocarpus siliculosus]|uniref:NHL repeat-containing protein n=1 Tax=Ectocarpus siliculosus TaxID=2880 RepID=D7FIV4_ECTSI|nr:NHL repeat-containing protein [Ectocarpus siliculosus]|eukprot:CBJ28938.1 NHL repeat-containing protein [Ectocarpus siliculosus]